MTPRTLYVTQHDKNRLEELARVAGEFGGHARKDVDSLVKELERAVVVSPKDVPPDVVTMNSKVVLRDLDTSERMEYTLVFPHEANIETGRLSILSPVGTAILGYATGDSIEWDVPGGKRQIRIAAVPYQPEAAGHQHL